MVKLTKRKGFNFFRSYYDVYNELETAEDKVLFLDALFDRQFLGIKPDLPKGMAKFAYISQTNSIDSQVKGYEDKLKSINKGVPNFDPWQGVKKNDLSPAQQEKEQVQVQEKEQVKEKVKRVYSDEVNECFLNCLNYFENHLHPKNKNTWLDVIDKLNRIDKIPFEIIEKITKQARQDDFWRTNFMSLTKLRQTQKSSGLKYIVVLNEKFKNNGTGITKTNSKPTLSELYEQHKGYFTDTGSE